MFWARPYKIPEPGKSGKIEFMLDPFCKNFGPFFLATLGNCLGLFCLCWNFPSLKILPGGRGVVRRPGGKVPGSIPARRARPAHLAWYWWWWWWGWRTWGNQKDDGNDEDDENEDDDEFEDDKRRGKMMKDEADEGWGSNESQPMGTSRPRQWCLPTWMYMATASAAGSPTRFWLPASHSTHHSEGRWNYGTEFALPRISEPTREAATTSAAMACWVKGQTPIAVLLAEHLKRETVMGLCTTGKNFLLRLRHTYTLGWWRHIYWLTSLGGGGACRILTDRAPNPCKGKGRGKGVATRDGKEGDADVAAVDRLETNSLGRV